MPNLANILNNILSDSGVDISTLVPSSRTLTINGTTFDLSANRSWTISGGVSGSGTLNFLPKWGSSTSLTDSLIFDNGTNVGIGTASPSEKLEINGSLRLSDGNADGPQLRLASSGFSDWNIDNFSGSLRAYYGSTEYFRFTNTGNILIGTTSATAFNRSLVINSVSSTAGILFQLNGVDKGFIYSGGGDLFIGSNSNTLQLYTNGSERFRIDSSGNVGIGTTTPNRALVVRGGNQEQLVLISTTTKSGINLNPSDTTYSPYIGATGNSIITETSGVERMRITSGGNVGIGTSSPSYLLTVAAPSGISYIGNVATTGNNAIIRQFSGTYSADFGVDATGPYIDQLGGIFRFYKTGGEAMRISTGGDVLIGRTTPAYVSTGMTQVSIQGSSRGAISLTSSGSGSTGIMWYGSEQIDIYNTSTTGSIKVMANTNGVILGVNGSSWSSASDERLKTDILPIQNGLEKVSSLRAITGRYKKDKEGTSRSFLIAQDVQSVLPEAVSINQEDGYLNLSYTDVIPLLVAGIKELKMELDNLKSKNQ